MPVSRRSFDLRCVDVVIRTYDNKMADTGTATSAREVGRGAVTLAIDPEHRWNAERLKKLAVALTGVAGALEPECSRGSSSASEA